jgi:hypothetical protein
MAQAGIGSTLTFELRWREQGRCGPRAPSAWPARSSPGLGSVRRSGSGTNLKTHLETAPQLAAADGDRTVVSWGGQARPQGWLRMLGPLFGPLGGRMGGRIWAGLKRHLANTAARSATRPAP